MWVFCQLWYLRTYECWIFWGTDVLWDTQLCITAIRKWGSCVSFPSSVFSSLTLWGIHPQGGSPVLVRFINSGTNLVQKDFPCIFFLVAFHKMDWFFCESYATKFHSKFRAVISLHSQVHCTPRFWSQKYCQGIVSIQKYQYFATDCGKVDGWGGGKLWAMWLTPLVDPP